MPERWGPWAALGLGEEEAGFLWEGSGGGQRGSEGPTVDTLGALCPLDSATVREVALGILTC